jgi:serine carboxypeptidase-like clade 2
LACDFDSSTHASDACNKIFDVAYDEEGLIDAYSIYTPTCKKSSLDKRRLIKGRRVS